VTAEIVGGIVLVLLVCVFGFDRSRLSKKVGALQAQADESKRKADQYESALAILVAPDPTLDELERMSALAAEIGSARQLDLPIVEQRRTVGVFRSRSDRKERKGEGR
jgi:hypothetical protein